MKVKEIINKKYRQTKRPVFNVLGRYEYFYNGKWHTVKNWQIRADLDRELKRKGIWDGVT